MPESEVQDKMPDIDRTMESNRPLLRKDTADVGTETERLSPEKNVGLDGLAVAAPLTQREVSKSKIILGR